MDKRTALGPDSILNLGGLDCCVEDVVGRGSNAIVYKGWYPDRLNPGLKHHVLIKELFPWHPTGRIYRSEEGTIVVERDTVQLWEDHKQSFCAGNEIHLRLLEKRPEALGSNLNSCTCNGTLYSILGYSGGRALEAELSRWDATLRRCVLWMLDVLDALEAFHQSGYLHLDISPNNIMLTGTGRTEQIFLIDYNTRFLTPRMLFSPTTPPDHIPGVTGFVWPQ